MSLAGLAIFDSLLTCIVADKMIGERHSSDRECFGQGLANMSAGIVGGLTTATATMRTIANVQSGGKTPLASVFHGAVLLALVLGLAPLAEGIPLACLAAILFKVGIDILDYRIFPVLGKIPVIDKIIFWSVLIVTVIADLLIAMGVGIALAFIRFVQEVSKAYKPQLSYVDEISHEIKPMEETYLSDMYVNVLRPKGPLFFGSVQALEDIYQEAKEHDMLIIDLKEVSMMDLSGAFALEDLAKAAFKKGVHIAITGASGKVASILKKSGVINNLGDGKYFDDINSALDHALKLGLLKVTYR